MNRVEQNITKLYNLILIILLVISSGNVQAQKIFYADLFNGGVSGAGINRTKLMGNLNKDIHLHIEENSTIRKAFMFFTSRYVPEKDFVYFNGKEIEISKDNFINNQPQTYQSGLTGNGELNIGVVDISNQFELSDSVITPIFPNANSLHPNPIYFSFYFLVFYENSNLAITNTNVIVNTQDNNSTQAYNLGKLNPMNDLSSIGLIVNSSDIVDTTEDGSNIYVENNHIGLIGGNDENTAIGGVVGCFYNESNSIFGLSDDTLVNNMQGYDAVADIREEIEYRDSINILVEYQSPNKPDSWTRSNSFFEFFLTYTTTCDTFTVDIPSEVVLCRGDSAEIEIQGASHLQYEWEPQINLSCYNCANPTYTGDSTMYYTVRVWNNDSCSKVLPVHVKVEELPQIPQYIVEGADCVPNNTGHFYATSVPQISTFSLDGGTQQNSTHFYNLTAGTHQLQVTEVATGCQVDTSIFVPSIINVNAQIQASPTEGELPLTVSFNDASIGNTNAIWYLNNDTLTNNNFDYLFTESNNYEVVLVSFDTYDYCSDTAKITIHVSTPFKVVAPSWIDQNSAYPLTTYGCKSLLYELFDASGKLVYRKELQQLSDGVYELWLPIDLSNGTYLYNIQAVSQDGENATFSGKVVVVR